MDLAGYLLLVVLTLVGAFFALTEIAMTAARPLRLQMLAEHGHPAAERVLALKQAPGALFTVVQIGVNAVAIGAGVLVEAQATPALTRWLANWLSAATAERLAAPAALIATTTVFILFADLIPKRIAMVYPEQLALRLIVPIRMAIRMAAPLVWLITWICDRLIAMANIPLHPRDQITSEDISAMVDAGTEAGILPTQQSQLIGNVFELGHRSITSVMTVRDQIVYFVADEDAESIRHKLTTQPHAQFPVCKTDIDSFIGTIDSKDILQTLLESPRQWPDVPLLQATQRQVLVIPDSLNLSEALARFHEMHANFAMILSEYGHVVGLVTVDDIVGTLVGDLHPDEDPQIVVRADGSWLVDGMTPVAELKRALDIDVLPGDELVETTGGLIVYAVKRIPRKSETIELGGFRFEVLDIDHHKIDQLLVTALPPIESGSEPDC